GLVKALSNLGSVYYMQGKTDASEKMLLQALGLSEKAGYKLGMAESSQVLGDICRQRGMIEKALTYYRLSINCLDKLNFDDLLCKNYQGLFSCYQHKGDYPQALHYHILLLDAEKKL